MQSVTQWIHLLGTVEITEEGRSSPLTTNGKGCALLTYLVVTGQPQSRETVADLLWEAASTAQSLRNLRVLLTRIRPWLPELQATRAMLSFQPDPARPVDLLQLLTALQSDEMAALDAGLRLYRGDLLASLHLEDAPRFNEWLLVMRERLRRQVLLAYDRLCETYAAQQQWAQGMAAARRRLALDELDERAHRWLMTHLAGHGQVAQAMEHYAALCRLLRHELAAEPEPETVALYQRIRGDDREEKRVAVTPPSPQRWSDVPLTGSFFGCKYELSRLEQWLVYDSCRLVAVLGIGGVGKTTLAAQAARRVATHFARVIWRSLLNAPPLTELLPGLLQAQVDQPLADLPNSLDEQLTLLLGSLRRQRTLIVLDNLESILDPAQAGHVRVGYEPYGQLLQWMATREHQSTLLLTSREQPNHLARLEGDAPWVRSLLLEGLDEAAGHDLLAERGVIGSSVAAAALVARYSGNPLALKLVADTVQELFAGDVESFLAQETLIFDDVRTLLDQQMDRLTELERGILFWLAVEREPVNAQTLRQNLAPSPPGRLFFEALRNLQKRSLIERHSAGFALQNVITEYLTARLVEVVCAEIQMQQPDWLHRHALLKANARDYVRQSQARLILAPIAAQLQATLGKTMLEGKLQQILAKLHQSARHQPSYAGGNLLNLLLHLKIDITGYDFSHLSVWQADLRDANLTSINLGNADLTHTTFAEAFGHIFALAITPDGQFLAAGGAQGEVHIWSFPHGQHISFLPGHANAVTSIAFSPDGALLASGSLDGAIRLWNWRTGERFHVLKGEGGSVHALAFSAVDGTLLASGNQDGTVRLWDTTTGQSHAVLTQHNGAVLALAFHPTRALLASGGFDHAICLWSVSPLPQSPPQGEPVAKHLINTFHGHGYYILALAFRSDGQVLASSSADTTVRLWSVADGQPLKTLHGHVHWVRALAFSPDGYRLFSGSSDRTVRSWDVIRGQGLEILRGHTHSIRTLAVSPDGATLATGGLDDSIRLWDLRRRSNDSLFRTLQGYATPVRSVAFSPDGATLAIGDGNGRVRLWRADEIQTPGSPFQILPDPGFQVNALAFSLDGRWLAVADDDTTVRIWNLPTDGKAPEIRVRWFHGHSAAVHTVAFAHDNRILASGGYDGAILLWDVNRVEGIPLINRLLGHRRSINSLLITPDGRHLISGSADQTIRLWDLTTGQAIHVIDDLLDTSQRLALHPTGSILAAAGITGAIRLYSVNQWNQMKLLTIIPAHASRVRQLKFSPNGSYLASCSEDGVICLWDAGSGQLRQALEVHKQPVLSVAFRPDGRLFAGGSEDGTVSLWEIEKAEKKATCVQILRMPGPYAGMNIAGVTGISEAQKMALKALGAVEDH